MTDDRCLKCNTILSKEAKFCENCGTPLAKKTEGVSSFCSGCGTKIPKEAGFCPECGLTQTIETPQSVQPKSTPSTPQSAVTLEILCSPDWSIFNIKSIIETFCINFAESMKLEELKSNELQVTCDSGIIESLLAKSEGKCLECGTDLPENAGFCTNCGTIKLTTSQIVAGYKKSTPQSGYKAIFRILDDRKKGRYILIEYEEGVLDTKEFVKIFWENFQKGLQSVVEKPFLSFK